MFRMPDFVTMTSDRMPAPGTPAPGSKLPARRLSSEQVEAVVRRAIELQTHDAASTDETGVSSEELVRIGGELGISAGHMRRALAEVSTHAAPQPGGGLLGAARTSASRAVPGTADAVRRHIERYLLECAYLAVLRRLPDRTTYDKSTGFQVEMARALDATRGVISGRRTRRIGAGFDLRSVRAVEVSVTPLEDGWSWVTLAVDLSNQRTGYWLGFGSTGAAVAGGVGLSAAVIFAPVAALVAAPLVAASAWGARTAYTSVLERARLHLEALLDHLERGESLLRD
jgi:hypothetical protein